MAIGPNCPSTGILSQCPVVSRQSFYQLTLTHHTSSFEVWDPIPSWIARRRRRQVDVHTSVPRGFLQVVVVL